uniref:EF-hand domain-containing protein n=1 Tax=Haptolina ericina TaxID=156174 RepID=A0A7S3AFY2_9EUKA
MEFDAGDVDHDESLDFDEFCKMVREREMGEHTTAELRKRFDALDTSGNGKLAMSEYLRYALRDALARSSTRVVELFQQWDVDKSGFIDRKEFRRAVQELGFNARDKEIDIVFDEYDEDNSGELDYRELNKKMRQFAGVEVEQRHALRRISGGRKGAAFAVSVHIQLGDSEETQAALREIVRTNAVRLLDIFRDWDADGDGLVSKPEFRRAMHILSRGMNVPMSETDAAQYDELFTSYDLDGNGSLEYSELSTLMRSTTHAPKLGKPKRKILSQPGLTGRERYLNLPVRGVLSTRPDMIGSRATVRADIMTDFLQLPPLEARFRAVDLGAASQTWMLPVRGLNKVLRSAIQYDVKYQRPRMKPPLNVLRLPPVPLRPMPPGWAGHAQV